MHFNRITDLSSAETINLASERSLDSNFGLLTKADADLLGSSI